MTIHMILMSVFGAGTIFSLVLAFEKYAHAEGKMCVQSIAAAVFFGGMTYLNWWAQVQG